MQISMSQRSNDRVRGEPGDEVNRRYEVQVNKYIKNSSNYNVEYRDGKGDKIGMPCTESTVI